MATKDSGNGWIVTRKSDSEVELVLPEGMKFTSENLSIQDIFDAIEKHKVMIEGEVSRGTSSGEVVIKCCSGNTAIA